MEEQDFKDLLLELELEVHKDLLDSQDSQVQRVELDIRVLLDILESLDLLDLLDILLQVI